MKRWLPLAVGLYAVEPVIGLYASNSHRGVSADQLVAWIPLVLLLAAAAYLALSRVLRGPQQATVAAILLVGWFFTGTLQRASLPLGFALAGIVALSARRWNDQTRLAELLAMLGVIFLAIAAWPAVRFHAWQRLPASAFAPLEVPAPSEENRPDVYYLVLDGYARPDVFTHIGAAPDGPFVEALRSRGFEVSDRSRSNYAQTLLSVASILSLDHLQALSPPLDPRSNDRLVLMDSVRDNRLTRLFARAGYRIASARSPVSFLPTVPADLHLGPLPPLDDFDHFAIGETVLPMFADLLRPRGRAHLQDRLHRRTVLETLRQAGRLPPDPRPTFAFVHVLSPHPPFVYDADGAEVPRSLPYHITDGLKWQHWPRDASRPYAEQYSLQTRWLNARLIEVIDEILARPRPSIIVLQGDHGSAVEVDLYGWGQPSDMFERFGAFQAWHWPGGRPTSVPETITPVNGVRVLVNEVLGLDLPLLPDTSWFSDWTAPYAFRDVTIEASTAP